MKEDINKKVTKEIHAFCKTIFENYPEVTGVNIHGDKQNLSISIKSTLVR